MGHTRSIIYLHVLVKQVVVEAWWYSDLRAFSSKLEDKSTQVIQTYKYFPFIDHRDWLQII